MGAQLVTRHNQPTKIYSSLLVKPIKIMGKAILELIKTIPEETLTKIDTHLIEWTKIALTFGVSMIIDYLLKTKLTTTLKSKIINILTKKS